MHTFNLTIPGFTIAAQAWGDKSLPPMLALHGWLDNANSFNLIAPLLANQFHIIAIDLPGHGLSSHLPPGCNYHFIDGIFTVINIISALGQEKVHLLGHSMGACLASLVAGVIPNQLLSLTLLEGIGPFSSPAETCHLQLSNFAHYCLSASKEAKPYSSLQLAAEARAKSGHLSLQLANILCERGVEERDGLFYWRHDRRLIFPSLLRMTEEQILSCLKAITAKTCLIEAVQGFAFDTNLMKKRTEVVQNLTIHKLQGGHHLHMEKPEALVGCLSEFYRIL